MVSGTVESLRKEAKKTQIAKENSYFMPMLYCP
jgi:hypothetical protein